MYIQLLKKSTKAPMSISRTQQFLYFQNKSKHYSNLQKIKPKVDDKLPASFLTLDHHHTNSQSPSSQKQKNKNNKVHKFVQPHLKRYSIDVENQKMINRLVGIVNSKRKEVVVQGDYSRYNDTERKWRKRNPYREGVLKRIQEENQGIVNKLANVKPLVGSSLDWMHQYQRKFSHRKNLRNYLQSNKSKGSLHISMQKFVPEHYKTLLQGTESPQNSRKIGGVTVVTKQQLISFPKLLHKQKSSSVLSRSKSKESL